MREINLYNIYTDEDLTFDENDIKGIANLLIELLGASTEEISKEVLQAINYEIPLCDENGHEIQFNFREFLESQI